MDRVHSFSKAVKTKVETQQKGYPAMTICLLNLIIS